MTATGVTKRYGWVLLLVTLGTSRAAAQGSVELTLEDAITRGLAQAPRVAEARAREAAADAAIAARSALSHPSVTASSGYLRTNHVDEFGVPQAGGGTRVIFPDIPNNYRVRAEMTMPIYTGGRVGDLQHAAEADRHAADADRRAATADVTLDVARAYWTLVTARARVSVLQRAEERADAMTETVRARVDAGILPPNDVLTAQAQRARQHVQLIQAQNDAALAEADLARLIGAPPGQSILTTTAVDRATPGVAEIAGSAPDALARRAVEARPERQAISARQSSLRAAAAAAGAATRPQVGVLAGVEPARPNPRFVPRTDTWNTGWDLAVNVTWSVWDGGRARADRAAATAQADALQHRADEFDAGVGLEVRQRLLDLSFTQAAIAASSEAVDAAAEARRVLGERFLAGVATNTDVLDADVALREAELERTRLLATLRFGEARLLRTVGAP